MQGNKFTKLSEILINHIVHQIVNNFNRNKKTYLNKNKSRIIQCRDNNLISQTHNLMMLLI